MSPKKNREALISAMNAETEKDPQTDLRGFLIGWNAATKAHAEEESRKPWEPLAIEVKPFMRWPEWFHQAVSDNRIITSGIGKWGEGPAFCEVGGVRVDEGGWIINHGRGLHPCPLPKTEQAAGSDDAGYEAIEREHLGDSEKKTGIYAPKAAKPAPAVPDGWREVIKRAREGLAAGERSRSSGDYELEFGGALIDGIEELLEGLAAAPEVPR